MIEYYDKEFLRKAKKQKSKVIIIFTIITAIFALITTGNLLWYFSMLYLDSRIIYVKLIEYPLIFAYVLFAFIYMGIKFKRVNKYCKLLKNVETGIKESGEGSFLGDIDKIMTKDGVDVKALNFLVWNKYKQDFFERKIFILLDQEFPSIEPNSIVKFITQSNILVSYEILDKEELEKEKV